MAASRRCNYGWSSCQFLSTAASTTAPARRQATTGRRRACGNRIPQCGFAPALDRCGAVVPADITNRRRELRSALTLTPAQGRGAYNNSINQADRTGEEYCRDTQRYESDQLDKSSRVPSLSTVLIKSLSKNACCFVDRLSLPLARKSVRCLRLLKIRGNTEAIGCTLATCRRSVGHDCIPLERFIMSAGTQVQ